MDDLERRIRAANPSTVRRDSPLTPRAFAELQELTGSAPSVETIPAETIPIAHPRPSRRRAFTLLGSTVAFAAAIAVVILVVLPFGGRGSVAHAATLDPLSSEPIGGDAAQLLEKFRMQLFGSDEAPPSGNQEIGWESWSLAIDNAPGGATTSVQPREISVSWSPAELSGTLTVVVGQEWDTTTGQRRVGSNVGEPAGTVIQDESFGPGAFPVAYPDEPPVVAAAMKDYLQAWMPGLDDGSNAAAYMRAASDLMQNRQLLPAQEAALIEVVSEQSGISVYGSVTDRLGREGVALQADFDEHFRQLLIFAPSSGRIIAAERIYLGGLNSYDVPSPSVTEYLAWRRP
ncbi:hypothetical protein [Luethyella okanaganae]|uniref:Uncharacterized protein n=1 Tax=Luethyella okanaganae TaxID=69372 RepID=A0ABW1VEM4_9MICO